MSRHVLFTALAVAAMAVSASACATKPSAPKVIADVKIPASVAFKAPQPAKPVDIDRLYNGLWHEIARDPMKLTDGCVAGITAFIRDNGLKDAMADRDSCRMGDPNTGKEKVFAGPMHIDDPGTNAKFTTRYQLWDGWIVSKRTYWILDHDDAYSWFIVAAPYYGDLSIFTRDPQISPAERDSLVARAKALGYDVAKLEYPAQPAK